MYFESDTVKSDCPIQIFRKIMKYLKIYYRLLVNLLVLLFLMAIFKKLDDLMVMKRSPNLLNNVRIGRGQLRLIMKIVLPYMGGGGCGNFGQVS